MQELARFRRQFIFTFHDNFDLPWKSEKILNYNLFYHPELEFTHVSSKDSDLYLLGFIFDYENPQYSNEQVLESLSKTGSFDHFIEHLSEYSGHFVILYRSNKRFILLNDACAQQEVFYDVSYSTFGSQPKLIGEVIPPQENSNLEAKEFYSSSPYFLIEKIFVGDTTHTENIKHLRPNHYIDIEHKRIIRFFPRVPVKPISMNEAATKASEMIKGYIHAASLRNNLYMGVTGGYDSRVLFLSSLEVNCKYYVTKHNSMREQDFEIVIPQKLASLFSKEFRVVIENPLDDSFKDAQNMSIDFPREFLMPDEEYSDHLLINGNLSEIARNSFGNLNPLDSREITTLYGYKGCNFFRNQCEIWLRNSSDLILENGYRILDIFYWEERMGNWAAKAKTESSILGTTLYSPFSSHKLLTTLLSTKPKERDKRINKLYFSMINGMSPESAKIPINPSLKIRMIKLVKRLQLFDSIQRIQLKIANLKYSDPKV